MPSSELAPGVWLEEFTDSSFLITEKSGRASVTIHRGTSPTTSPAAAPFQVRQSGNVGQEIINECRRILNNLAEAETKMVFFHLDGSKRRSSQTRYKHAGFTFLLNGYAHNVPKKRWPLLKETLEAVIGGENREFIVGFEIATVVSPGETVEI